MSSSSLHGLIATIELAAFRIGGACNFILARIAWSLKMTQELTTAFRGAASKFDDVTKGNELSFKNPFQEVRAFGK